MNVREQLFETERTFVPVHLFGPQSPPRIGLNRVSKGRAEFVALWVREMGGNISLR